MQLYTAAIGGASNGAQCVALHACMPIIHIHWQCGSEAAEGNMIVRGRATPRIDDVLNLKQCPCDAAHDPFDTVDYIDISPKRNFWPMRVPYVASPITINCHPLGQKVPLGWWLRDLGITTSDVSRGKGVCVGLIDVKLPQRPQFSFMPTVVPTGNHVAAADIEHSGELAALMGGTTPDFPYEGVAPGASYLFAESGAVSIEGHVSITAVEGAIRTLSEDHHCDLICVCAGDYKQPVDSLLETVRDAEAIGALCVFSGGAGPDMLWPALYPEIIAVGAYGWNTHPPVDTFESFRRDTGALQQSTDRYVVDSLPFADQLSFLAPGIAVETGVSNEVVVRSGTSHAAAIATGALAALFAKDHRYMRAKIAAPDRRAKVGRDIINDNIVKSRLKLGARRDVPRVVVA